MNLVLPRFGDSAPARHERSSLLIGSSSCDLVFVEDSDFWFALWATAGLAAVLYGLLVFVLGGHASPPEEVIAGEDLVGPFPVEIGVVLEAEHGLAREERVFHRAKLPARADGAFLAAGHFVESGLVTVPFRAKPMDFATLSMGDHLRRQSTVPFRIPEGEQLWVSGGEAFLRVDGSFALAQVAAATPGSDLEGAGGKDVPVLAPPTGQGFGAGTDRVDVGAGIPASCPHCGDLGVGSDQAIHS